MVKSRWWVFVFVILVLIPISAYIYKQNISLTDTSQSASENLKFKTALVVSTDQISEFYSKVDYKIAFLVILIIALLSVVILYLRRIERIKEEGVRITYRKLKEKIEKSSTEIDLFYELLKEKKKLKISTIYKIFEINKETALEWAKILEDHNLAVINYPAIFEPTVEVKNL